MPERHRLARMLTTRNVGAFDRLLRTLPALIVAALISRGVLPGPLAWGLAIIAAMLLLTAVTGSCSIYYLLGLSTCPVPEAAGRRDVA